jgi:hypothetical protein
MTLSTFEASRSAASTASAPQGSADQRDRRFIGGVNLTGDLRLSIPVTVSVEKSGSLKSGHETLSPCRRSRWQNSSPSSNVRTGNPWR